MHLLYACPVILRLSNWARKPRIWCGTIPSGERPSCEVADEGVSSKEAGKTKSEGAEALEEVSGKLGLEDEPVGMLENGDHQLD